MSTDRIWVEVEQVSAGDGSEVKRFTAAVIAGSVTREDALLAELVENVEGNVDWWLDNPQDGVHLKAVANGMIVGVVLVKSFWNLCSLFVHPALQGHGLGGLLLDEAIRECGPRNKTGWVRLNASPRAVPFYARHGFVPRAALGKLPPGFVAMERVL